MVKLYNIVNMKQSVFFILVLSLMLIGCGSRPASQPEESPAAAEPAPAAPAPVPETKPIEAVFDPGSISQEHFANTKADVQKFIEELNTIIKNKNYNAWKANLSDEYFREISSPEFLKATSEWPILKSRKIVLSRPEDYFTNVVVPSRANSKVDDIEFSSQKRVKVITINSRNERLRLYELEQTGNTWKIIN